MKKTVVAVLALCALLLALLPAGTASAGPKSREDVVQREAAVLAELMAKYRDQGPYPRTFNNKRAKKDLDYEVAEKARIVHYKRLNGGDDYRLCVVHKNGGWATFSSRTGDLKSSGRGAACRF